MSRWINKVIGLKGLARLHAEQAGAWLLLEILERNANDDPVKFRLLAYGPDKDALHDLLLEDDTWDWDKTYLFVLADPTKPCIVP